MKSRTNKLLLFFFAAIFMMSCFCSCGNEIQKVQKLPTMSFSADAEIKYKTYDIIYCKITSIEDESLTLELTKPVILSGLTLVCRDGSSTVKYGSLSYDLNIQKHPQLAFSNMLEKSVESLQNIDEYKENEDSTLSFHTVVDAYDVWLKVDSENFNLISLEIPKEELLINFYNFKQIQPEQTSHDGAETN